MRIVVVGCGRVGAYVARRLGATGHQVCVVDQDPQSLARLGPDFSGHTVTGMGFDEEVLRRARVAEADGVAVLTNLDTTNFMVTQAVIRLFRVPGRRVVVRINDPEFSALYAELGVKTVDMPDLVLAATQDVLAGGSPVG